MRRLPFRPGTFDVVASFFTSFGYFEEAEDRVALAEAARVLAPGGWHVLDYLNRSGVLAHPMRAGERVVRGYRVHEDRRLDGEGRRVVKRIEISPEGGGETLAHYEERVTLYAPEEIRAMLAALGLRPCAEWGGYDASPFDAARSGRHVVLSRRERP
jgi:SAM-dependent methyltransferase